MRLVGREKRRYTKAKRIALRYALEKGEVERISMKEIVVLTPLEAMRKKAEDIVVQQGYHNVEVLPGSMSRGVEVARQAIGQGAELIVTRGGTYQLVKAAFSIPVVEIKVTAYDLLQSFEEVKDPDEPIGIVGYSNVIYGYDLLRKLLPNPIEMVVLKREEDTYAIIETYKKRGIQTYIGDSNITDIVRELDCNGILIQSQTASIHTAIQEGRRILQATKEEKRRAQQIAAITDFMHDAVLAIDEHGKINIYNKLAEQIFKVPRQVAMGSNINDVVVNSRLDEILRSGQAQLGELQNLHDSVIVTNRVPIIVDGKVRGAVATFQEITEFQNLEQKVRISMHQKGFFAKYTFDDIVYVSDKIRSCIETAQKYAAYDTPIHICGASGVGKELFCQSIHNHSRRREGPFVAINCAAIPSSLIESEFFGYAEGSFTGAKRKGKQGIFELAHNGTLFLDEISEIPMELQGRLLRVLQEKQVMRVGGDKIIPVDVKIITASNKYLKREMQEGRFRKDLYYRINVLTLRIPSLATRREDIPVLARYFLKKYAEKYKKMAPKPDEAVWRHLMNRSYGGNIRELEGLMERSVIVSSFQSILEEEDVMQPQAAPPPLPEENMNLDLKSLEAWYIRKVYDETGQSTRDACEKLGINRSTLWRKLKEQ